MDKMKNYIIQVFFICILSGIANAQFLDDFDGTRIKGWFVMTGDGAAKMEIVQKDGFARLYVDGTKDKYNVYWTLIKRNIAHSLDLSKLKDPDFELRVEAKVRIHNAPRRLNMMVNTQRTVNFHIDLMEYDIADTTDWHTISMTTHHLDAVPGDSLFVQLCVTDYGLDKYSVDVDYYRADIINVKTAGPDNGELVPYDPPIPDVKLFSNHLNAAQDCLINSDFPDVNFNDWHAAGEKGDVQILTINADQWAILRWDFNNYRNMKADGSGLLELTTYAVQMGGDYIGAFGEDFGIEFDKFRVIEILGGDAEWDQNKVTFESMLQGHPYKDVFNTQMIYDTEPAGKKGAKNFITISRPVLQRLLDGTTKGLLIRPLGAITVSFYTTENGAGSSPKLHFNIKK